ncbi:SDR family oxidoreductase [Planktomarina temperata]|nr:SDR family oxidoreductase [Planktomarina temperata]
MIEKKVVVITGGSKGIGLSIAKLFATKNYRVIICSRHRPKPNQLKEIADDCSYFELNLSDELSVKSCVRSIFAEERTIEVLINCAGKAIGGSFLMTPLQELRSMFEINYFNTLLFTQYIAKKMIAKKSGAIINIASTAGLLADRGTLCYGGSKAALMHATKVLSSELGVFGIRVNAIAPSIVETDMAKQMDDDTLSLLYERRSLKGEKIFSNDVAELAYFLGTNSSSKITGQIIRIDCGNPF